MTRDCSVFEALEATGIIPVIKIDSPEAAAALGKALLDGGIPIAEVTFRTQAAAEAIAILSETCPQLLVGAGTVLSVEQVDRAVEAGAKFIVSPGLNPDVVQHCRRKAIPVIPGCCTPGDIEKALGFGLDTVKFFPA
jgi:2-dehydro-3-deoxyphosphogluconate aldolase/(4S)-4-hydroxy-2-oxoglutarate aldolase